MSDAQFEPSPGNIRASLYVTCAICSSETRLPGKSVIKAGAYAREAGWEIQRNAGGWLCPSCVATIRGFVEGQKRERQEAADAERDHQAAIEREAAERSLRAWRERNGAMR